MFTTTRQLTAGAAALLSAGATIAQVSTFDLSSKLLTIPSVSVGSSTFADVSLLADDNFVFSLRGATEQKPAGPGVATYDLGRGVVILPAVQVGADTYLDVTLADSGNNTFALQGATLLAAATLAEIKAFVASYDALWARAVPASGAMATSMMDACYRSSGRTRAWLTADFDQDLASSLAAGAYNVGATRTKIQVLALRNQANADGSSRREVDVQYDIGYADGSRTRDVRETLISGSSAGTPGCASAQSSAGWRFLGNQRLVGFSLDARTLREARHSMATGAALNPEVRYRRDIRVRVSDPLANATHVVVSGPGPGVTVNGVNQLWAWKMVSPFLMRSAPELAGKSGNYVNFEDDDGFRYCGVNGTGTPQASLADCLTYGAQGDNWGWGYTSTPDAAADQGFANQGWAVGGVYRIDVYNDDGWKTVNGQAGRTPIATYYETLKALPHTFVEMAGSGTSPTTTDQFARLNLGALGATGVLANSKSATPAALALSWSTQPPLSTLQPLRLVQGWEYAEGLKTGSASGASWPRVRQLTSTYPGPTATSAAAWPAAARPAESSSRSYLEYLLYFSDRNQGIVQSRISFQ